MKKWGKRNALKQYKAASEKRKEKKRQSNAKKGKGGMIVDQETWVSGYRLMWVIVMFDLPVVEKSDRKAATAFRNYLLDEGFAMAQYSVYYRLLSGKEAVESLVKRVQNQLPDYGSVQVVMITDKQYENIRTFRGAKRENQKKPSQLTLF